MPIIDLQRVVRRAKAQARKLRDKGAFRRHGMVGPPEFWKEKRQFQIDFLMREGLQPSSKVIDVGCGTLRGGIPIIEYIEPGNYVGTEVRHEVLDEAREELRKVGLEDKRPQLLISDDFSRLTIDMRFDYAWAFSVLIHMADPISEGCVGFVGRHLADNGHFFANAKIGERRDGVGGRGFPVVTRPMEFYEAHASKAGLKVESMGTLASLGHVTGLAGDEHHMLRFSRA